MLNTKSSFVGLERQIKIQQLKSIFLEKFTKELNLVKLRAPLFFSSETHLNDGLNGEEPVSFKLSGINKNFEIVHSLAKWKRKKLYSYSVTVGHGIYAEMNAIRKQEKLSKYHSFLVDQFDWECVISQEQRNEQFLFEIVKRIFDVFKKTEKEFNLKNPFLSKKLPEEISIISSQDLYSIYPEKTADEREYLYVKEKKAAFIYQIGNNLPDGKTHQARAFDYDDWNLNGDIVFYDSLNDCNLEISSMGIRVDDISLKKQADFLKKEKKDFGEYHENIFKKIYPLTIGGGIGRSRLYMFFLEASHLAEVQDTEWTDDIKRMLEEKNISSL